jgi:hypothetical protein
MNRHLHAKAEEFLDGLTPTSIIPENENIKGLK